MQRTPIFGLTHAGLEQELSAAGYERYRADQVFYWLYNRKIESFLDATNLPTSMRIDLDARFSIDHPRIVLEQCSNDGTRKFLFELGDGARIETVFIPSESDEDREPRRRTLCLSTQVGCPLSCKFCATASMSVQRNLTAGEIAGQYAAVQKLAPERITNLVYMGMGEPMLNYDETMRSIEIITHERTAGVASGRITISTAGILDGIRRMADEKRKVKLAVSLHSADDAVRTALMPINKRYDIRALLAAVEYYYRSTRKRVTYEYILFSGINDKEEDIRALVRMARRVPSKINLIPFHSIDRAYPEGTPMHLAAPEPDRIEWFARRLREHNITVMLRSSSGKDIDAACGQLAVQRQTTQD